MHDAAFDAAGIDARYVLLELEADAVEGAVREARASDEWLGLGVTAPYKPVVAGLVDEVEPDALAIGAVNNVVRTDDGRLIGFNTDAPGFRAGVELAMGRSLEGADVVVVGAGGAAHAVVYACLDAGARQVTVANRTVDRASALVERMAAVRPGVAEAVATDDDAFRAALATADVAVNATTVGMIDPGATIPVERSPTTPRCSTSSTCRPRPRSSPRPGRAACVRPTARRCSSPRPPSRSSAGPAWAAWPTSCARPSPRSWPTPRSGPDRHATRHDPGRWSAAAGRRA